MGVVAQVQAIQAPENQQKVTLTRAFSAFSLAQFLQLVDPKTAWLQRPKYSYQVAENATADVQIPIWNLKQWLSLYATLCKT